jgi:AGZA family xanthine/uracil permease-like MFS transporter
VASSRGAPRSPSASANRRGSCSPAAKPPTSARAEPLRTPRWLAAGDVNGFLGLALDNVTNLVILASLLIGVFGFPAELVLGRMVPGTALGVLVGDLAYTWLAVRLMRRRGRDDVTAMPFGIDTPTLFAMVFGVLGPVKVATGDAMLAWKIGMVATLAIGLAKTALAFAGDWTRRVVPRAALLGSIAGVAVLLIAFLPMLKILREPLAGVIALGVLLLALIGRVRMPLNLPGAFAAVLAGTLVYWGAAWLTGHTDHAVRVGTPVMAVPWPTLAWVDALDAALPYLAVALPFALVTIIGGIDNTESAAAAGDEYRARDVLLTEALATIVAGACGGVVQNTPYIGHPAYKAMGARAGYTLATGLVIGIGAAVGVLSVLVTLLPEAAVAPILVFVGLEITAQAFLASPPRHGPAVALTFVPVAAAVVLIQVGSLLGGVGKSPADLRGDAALTYRTLLVLGNGFILTALLWGWALVTMIDRRFLVTSAVLAVASLATLVGLVHSPDPGGALFWPWAEHAPRALALPLAGAYGVLAALCAAASLQQR